MNNQSPQVGSTETELNALRTRIRDLETAIHKHGIHHYTCGFVGASREEALFKHQPIPPCNCWMSIAGQPDR